MRAPVMETSASCMSCVRSAVFTEMSSREANRSAARWRGRSTQTKQSTTRTIRLYQVQTSAGLE